MSEQVTILIVEDMVLQRTALIKNCQKTASLIAGSKFDISVLGVSSFQNLEELVQDGRLNLRGKILAILDHRLSDSSKNGSEIAEWLLEKNDDISIIAFSTYHEENPKTYTSKSADISVIDKGRNGYDEVGSRVTTWLKEQTGSDEKFQKVKDEIIKKMCFVPGSHNDLVETAAKFVLEKDPSKFPLLIVGDFGSGKNYLAEIVHELGVKYGERGKKYEAVGAVSSSNDQNPYIKLFGSKDTRNPSTSAFERVGNGTVVIDEAGDINYADQKNLTLLLNDREYSHLLKGDKIKVDSWVIFTTQNDEGLNQDLVDRMISIKVPSLRERQDDIPRLIETILERKAPDFSFGKSTRIELVDHTWQHVREIEKVIDMTISIKMQKFPGTKQIGPDEIKWEIGSQFSDNKTSHQPNLPDKSSAKTERIKDVKSQASNKEFFLGPTNYPLKHSIDHQTGHDAIDYIFTRWSGEEAQESAGDLANRNPSLASAVFLCFHFHLWSANNGREYFLKVFRGKKPDAKNPRKNMENKMKEILKPGSDGKNGTKYELHSDIYKHISPAFWNWCRGNGLEWPESLPSLAE